MNKDWGWGGLRSFCCLYRDANKLFKQDTSSWMFFYFSVCPVVGRLKRVDCVTNWTGICILYPVYSFALEADMCKYIWPCDIANATVSKQAVFGAWLNKCSVYYDEDVLNYETCSLFPWYKWPLICQRKFDFSCHDPFKFHAALSDISYQNLATSYTEMVKTETQQTSI